MPAPIVPAPSASSTSASPVASGLDGYEFARTALSDVDGARGRLVLRGHDVEALAGVASFEQVVGLFLDGALPADDRDLRRALGAARVKAFARRDALSAAAGDTPPAPPADDMDALRAAVAHLSTTGVDRDDALLVVAATAVYAAARDRARRGLAPVAPDPTRGHAADLLRMLRGDAPPAHDTAALDAYLTTVVDHGMNASTFAARVVASTGSDLVSAVVAGLGALKGPLHGGAPGPVLDMLDAVGAPARARPWLVDALARGDRVMGMGHRVYRVRDPRAAVLEGAIERLAVAAGGGRRLALARAVEQEATRLLAERKPDRPLRANVEFFTAVLLDAVSVDRRTMTPVFAAARVVGWCAHVFEQRAVGRLVRPSSTYVGPDPGVHAATSAPVGDVVQHPSQGG